jgi:hypothetical protein
MVFYDRQRYDRPHRTKIAILGFTSHRVQAPFNDPDWELWPLNDLYFELGNIFNQKPVPVDRLRWFQLHNWVELQDWGKPKEGDNMNPQHGPPHPRDPYHVNWLREASQHFPVYIRDARPELPDCIPYPRAAVKDYFAPFWYFTNSISWEIALAIMSLCPERGGRAVDGAELGIWGVDMMQGGLAEGAEYGWQRPSCEWLVGVAQGAGIKVTVPSESDLMKAAYQYGDIEDYYFRKRLGAYKKDIIAQGNNAQAQVNAAREHMLRMDGAKAALEWVERSHLPGDDGSRVARAPMPRANEPLSLLKPEEAPVLEEAAIDG